MVGKRSQTRWLPSSCTTESSASSADSAATTPGVCPICSVSRAVTPGPKAAIALAWRHISLSSRLTRGSTSPGLGAPAFASMPAATWWAGAPAVVTTTASNSMERAVSSVRWATTPGATSPPCGAITSGTMSSASIREISVVS